MLAALVSPETRDSWGDFTEAARDLGAIEDAGFGSLVNRAPGVEDVAYFKILGGVSESYQVTSSRMVEVASIITMVRHPGSERWMVHSMGHAVSPEDVYSQRTGSGAQWDDPQSRRMDAVPPESWLTQHGRRRADGSYKFTEEPRWERPTYIEFDVSMIEGRVSVAEAYFASRRMSKLTHRDAVRRFRCIDLIQASYMPIRTPNPMNPRHVSVYANMVEVESWTPPDEEALIALEANKKWWDQAYRIPLQSLAIEIEEYESSVSGVRDE
ncbi:hypothetical protein [Nocardia sputi]|uniref:hypothetical protein n=1 Tax=Nocardia sputi TaxID=2943705 RepID=UPI0020C06147|nr:hypothetical protein [Nocardia sputi]